MAKKSLKCKLDIFKIADGKVKRITCIVCSKYKDGIKDTKGLSKTWIYGTEPVEKTCLKNTLKENNKNKYLISN